MKILFIFTFFIISGAVRCIHVTGYSGGSVLINSWKPWCKDCFKYMNKLKPWGTIINYQKHNQWINKGRFTLFGDDKGYFMIFIRDLNTQDSGSYRFGVGGKWSIDMTLNVRENSCCGSSQTLMVNTGDTVTFSCQYSQEYKTNEKIILKEGSNSIDVVIYSGNTWSQKGQLTLFDNRDKNMLSVRITDVTSEDAGVYFCGVQLYTSSYNYSIITAVHLNIINSCCGSSQRLMVNTGDTVNFTCQYSQKYKTNEKIILKEGSDFTEFDMNTWNQKERFSISAERYKNLFTVKITDVRSEDAGVYFCGVQLYTSSSYSYSIITAVHLNIISKVGVVRVTGYSSGGIIIKCDQHQYQTSRKYLCKESDGCCERTFPAVQDQWMRNKDVSLYDDTRTGVLMVYFKELNTKDTGTYRCGVNVSQYTERFTEIKLEIKDDESLRQKMNKSVSVGDEVHITCQIPEEHQISPKLFCKEDENPICQTISRSEVKLNESVFTTIMSNVTVRDAGVYWCGAETSERDFTFISLTTKVQLNLIFPPVFGDEGGSAEIICPYDPIYKSIKLKYLCNNESKTNRLTVNDDVTASVFTVNISGLTAEDAGKYCCAIPLQTHTIYLYTHLSIITTKDLMLNKSEGDDVSITCHHHDEYQKVFCKADQLSMCVNDGVSLTQTSTGFFTVNMSDLRPEDSGIYWCGSHIITKVQLNITRGVSAKVISCICMTLPLLASLILFLRYIKTRDNKIPTDRRQRTEVSDAACDYENVKDIRQQFVYEETVIYSTTNHSDSARLPTIPSDLHCPLYSTVQLPTIPSDDLLYAAVSFHKHEDSVSDATVTFSKEEILTDYATVNCHERLD